MGREKIKESISKLSETLKDKPEASKVAFRAKMEWVKNLQSVALYEQVPLKSWGNSL